MVSTTKQCTMLGVHMVYVVKTQLIKIQIMYQGKDHLVPPPCSNASFINATQFILNNALYIY